MKAAVIGAGKWGMNHVRTLHGMGKLAGVAEANPVLAQAVRDQFPDVPVFESYEDLLDTDVPAICIATPAETHYKLAKAVLDAGKDVLIEKPMVLSSSDAESLTQLAYQKGRIVMVGHLLLYQPAIDVIKKALGDGLIGKVFSLHQDRLNLGRARDVENALWSLGVHDVAVLLYLAGSPVRDVVFSGHAGLNTHVEDDTYLHISFMSGALAHVHSSWLWPELRRQLTVIGSTGMLMFDELKNTVTHVRKSVDEKLNNVDEGSEVIFEGKAQVLSLELEHFLNCCDTRQEPKSSGESGIEVTRVMEMATRSLTAV